MEEIKRGYRTIGKLAILGGAAMLAWEYFHHQHGNAPLFMVGCGLFLIVISQ